MSYLDENEITKILNRCDQRFSSGFPYDFSDIHDILYKLDPTNTYDYYAFTVDRIFEKCHQHGCQDAALISDLRMLRFLLDSSSLSCIRTFSVWLHRRNSHMSEEEDINLFCELYSQFHIEENCPLYNCLVHDQPPCFIKLYFSSLFSANYNLLSILLKAGADRFKITEDSRKKIDRTVQIYYCCEYWNSPEPRSPEEALLRLHTMCFKERRIFAFNLCSAVLREAVGYRVLAVEHNRCLRMVLEDMGEPMITGREFRRYAKGFNGEMSMIREFEALLSEDIQSRAVKSLKLLSKSAIKKHMTHKYLSKHKVATLKLPRLLEEYILLRD